MSEIANHLVIAGAKALNVGNTWSIESVRRILNKDKYKGDILLQKTYVANYFTGERKVNCGKFKRYLLVGHHEGLYE